MKWLIKTQIMQTITNHKAEITNRNAKMYDEYHELLQGENAMKMAVIHKLMQKYRLYSATSVYNIIKQEAKRRNQE